LFSREQANQALEALREIAREHDPLIVFGHDSENWSELRHAPEHYS
jgi:hypothetical protein